MLRLALVCLVFAVACKSDDAKPAAEAEPAAEAPEAPAEPAPPRAELAADPGGHEGKHRFSVRFGNTEPDAGRALALTPKGSLLVAGYFKGQPPFGAGAAAQKSDGYVAALDASGKARWSATLAGPQADTADAVASDADGNALVAGSFAESLALGRKRLSGAGADDIFVAKLDESGAPVWLVGYGGRDIDAGHDVVAGADGTVYVTGVFRDVVRFGDTLLESKGDADIFVLALSPAGEVVWAKGFGGLGPDYGRDLEVDSRGDLLLLAEFSRGVDFGGGELGSNGNRDIALVKLSAEGAHRWSVSAGNHLDELAIGLAVDPADDILVTGSFDDELSFGKETHTAKGRSDAFVAKYAADDGALLWSRAWGGVDEDIGAAVATDESGNVYATGWFWETVDFGGDQPLESAGKKDVFLVKLSPEGAHLWSRRFGGPEADFGKGLAVTSEGGVVVTGTFHETIDLGGGALEQARADGALVPKGDVFVAGFSR